MIHVYANNLGYRELDILGRFLIEAGEKQKYVDLLNSFDNLTITYNLHLDSVEIITPLATFYPEDCE